MMFSIFAFAADRTIDGFEPYLYRNARGETMPYRLFVPRGYASDKRYPLVIWLHGAGGEGGTTGRRFQATRFRARAFGQSRRIKRGIRHSFWFRRIRPTGSIVSMN
jgi:dipeptidyl aminopeptidase/acylaminoacyl peptidase